MRLASVAFVVRDYDEAIGYFVEVLGFGLVEDSDLGGGKRWVRIAPPGGGAALLLARAVGDDQIDAIGKAAGGRVAFLLEVDDFHATYDAMRTRGVAFQEAPRRETYGWVAVFADLYGNRWDLIETSA